MRLTSVGIDAVEISRFRVALKGANKRFFATTFSELERRYCTAFSDPSPHFAGTFAAKEAIQKAVGADRLPLSAIEIRHEKSGRPYVCLKGRRNSSILISISHTKGIACAVAIIGT